MFEIYRPKKDSTIYEYKKSLNAGIDEILQLNISDDSQASRVLVSFPQLEQEFVSFSEDQTNTFVSYGYELSDSSYSLKEVGYKQTGDKAFNVLFDQEDPVNSFVLFGQKLGSSKLKQKDESSNESNVSKSDPKAWLRLWFAQGQGLPRDYEIEAFPIEKDWTEGTGRFDNVPPTLEPVNWIRPNESEKWNSQGGDYNSDTKSAERFRNEDPDLNMDVSLLLSRENSGMLLKRKNESLNQKSNLMFFSKDTRTIYVPQLLVGEDTYEFNTKNADPVTEENFTAYVSTLSKTYPQSLVRFNVTVEEKYEQKDFLGKRPTENYSPTPTYLPKRSLTWKIEDVRTGVTFFPFNKNYSAVSFDGDTHYFDVDLTNLFPKREYQIILKYTDPKTGREQIFDHNQTFKVKDGTEF